MKTALIAGASGLTGSALLELLLNSPEYAKVYSVVRRPTDFRHAKLVEIVADFEQLDYFLHDVKQTDDVFCCLGTTMKKAGSKEAFRKVDYHYPLHLAHWAKSMGAGKFLCISAMGADAGSMIFYNRVKGEMERDIGMVGIPCTTFFRPSLLLGDRKENRPGEKIGILIAKVINPLLIGPLLNYRGIEVNKVALAMLRTAQDNKTGVRVVLSGGMQ